MATRTNAAQGATARTGAANRGGRQQRREDIVKIIEDNRAKNDVTYLRFGVNEQNVPQVNKNTTLQITGALGYVKGLVKDGKTSLSKLPDTLLNAWVYYPDLQITGTVQNILDILEFVGYTNIPVGRKFAIVRDAEQIAQQDIPNKTFLTYATQSGNINVTSPDAVDLLYNNSFDPFATAVNADDSATGYKYNMEGGEDSEIIKLVFTKEKGEAKTLNIGDYLYWIQRSSELVKQTKVAPHTRGSNINELVNLFDDDMAELIAYYRSSRDYTLDEVKAQNQVQSGNRTKLDGIDVSNFNSNRASAARPMSLVRAVKFGDKVIPKFELDGQLVYGPVMFTKEAFYSASKFLDTIANPGRLVLKEGEDSVAVSSQYANEIGQLQASLRRLADMPENKFKFPDVKAATGAAQPAAGGLTRRARGGAPAASAGAAETPAPAPAPSRRQAAAAAAPPARRQAAPAAAAPIARAQPPSAGGAAPAGGRAFPPRQAPAAAGAAATARQNASAGARTAAPAPRSAAPAQAAPRPLPARQAAGVRPAGPPAAAPASVQRRAQAAPRQPSPRQQAAAAPTGARTRSPSPAPVAGEEEEGFEPYGEAEPEEGFNGARVRSRGSSRASSAGSPVVTADDE